MAGPQFVTPQPVHPSRPRRHFTLVQANKTLPLVKRIVADIVRLHDEVAVLQAKLAGGDAGAGKNQETQKALERGIEQLQAYVDELAEVGCELKDYQMGLIDFVGRHQGRDINLCWKLGEDKITHWHEMQAGVAGRQPVSLLDEGE
ncbi:MAG TPA: DUF2203 domain-containing protein [Tepidisphaeraceae bacterium]|jgi:hypothetical protein